MKEVTSISEFEQILKDKSAVMAYFSHDNCNVCKVLKPKLSAALEEHYPQIEQIYVNVEHSPELAGQHSIFTVPVVVFYFDGQESLRKSRSFGVGELMDYLERPYAIMFG